VKRITTPITSSSGASVRRSEKAGLLLLAPLTLMPSVGAVDAEQHSDALEGEQKSGQICARPVARLLGEDHSRAIPHAGWHELQGCGHCPWNYPACPEWWNDNLAQSYLIF
jgi:hypothetical protein